MPAFIYRAKKGTAQTINGQLIAESKLDAVEKVYQLGLIPILVEESHTAISRSHSRHGRVRLKELYLFSRQFASFLKAGIPILRALDLIAAQIKNTYFKYVIHDLSIKIRDGSTFSESLSQHPSVFSSLYVAMVRAGEESGNLKEAILRIIIYQRHQEEITSKIRTAVAYPILMLALGIGTVIYILTVVMPKITVLFQQFEQDLPGPTVLVMALSEGLASYGLWLIAGVVVLVFLLNLWQRSSIGRMTTSRILLSIPWWGNLLRKADFARFCRTLEILLKSGLPIVRSFQLAVPVIENDVIRLQMVRCQEGLLSGASFGKSLKEHVSVPEVMEYLVAVGEESGALNDTLEDIAEGYEQDIHEAIKITTSLLEPLLIIVVGGMIGFLVVAMLLPIFQLDIMAH
jgi:type IV pilus assembly protein PilC